MPLFFLFILYCSKNIGKLYIIKSAAAELNFSSGIRI